MVLPLVWEGHRVITGRRASSRRYFAERGNEVINPHQGVSHQVLFGQWQRLAGADTSIYPNYGGRFGFFQAECHDLVQGCYSVMGNYPPIFPTPGGGMTLDKVPDLLEFYGSQVIFLIGGALYSRSPNLRKNAQYFLSLVGR